MTRACQSIIVIHLDFDEISISGHLPFYAEERKMMFWLILKEKTRYPRHISGESREIISKLLAKNPDRSVLYFFSFIIYFFLTFRRLGSVGDAEEVMEQPFFAAIDWNDLKRKRITPPFRPEVRINTAEWATI